MPEKYRPDESLQDLVPPPALAPPTEAAFAYMPISLNHPRGYVADVAAALGFDQSHLPGNKIEKRTLEEFANPREFDLREAFEGDIYPLPQEGKYYQAVPLDNGRCIHCVFELDSEQTKTAEANQPQSVFSSAERRITFYKIEKIILSWESSAVDVSAWISPHVQNYFEVRQGDRPESDSKGNRRNYFTPNDDFTGGELVFERIHDLKDLFTTFHESGHELYRYELSTEESDKQSTARGLKRDMFNYIDGNQITELEALEQAEQMTFEEVVALISRDEREASEYSLYCFQQMRKIVPISEEEMSQIEKEAEDNWQTYDQGGYVGTLSTLLAPHGAVSNRAQLIESQYGSRLHQHYLQTKQLFKKYYEHASGYMDLVAWETEDASYEAFDSGSFLQVKKYGKPKAKIVEEIVIGLAHTMIYEGDGRTLKGEISLRSHEKAIQGLAYIDVVLTKEAEILNALTQPLAMRVQKAKN